LSPTDRLPSLGNGLHQGFGWRKHHVSLCHWFNRDSLVRLRNYHRGFWNHQLLHRRRLRQLLFHRHLRLLRVRAWNRLRSAKFRPRSGLQWQQRSYQPWCDWALLWQRWQRTATETRIVTTLDAQVTRVARQRQETGGVPGW